MKAIESTNANDRSGESTEAKVSRVWTAARNGRAALAVRMECALGRGYSGIHLIGNLGQVCDDGKERARSALERLGWAAPARRVVLSVSPGEVKIDYSHVDLAFAVALAGVHDDVSWQHDPAAWMFTAEVGIDGALRPVCGVVAWASAAMDSGLSGIIVARENLTELECLTRLAGASQTKFKVLAFETLSDVLAWLRGEGRPPTVGDAAVDVQAGAASCDFDDMDLSEDLRMVALVVAAGFHSVLMRGTPGSGKSMFARRLPSILPRMSADEHIHALSVHSASSTRVASSIIAGLPPFRAPHHYTSLAAMMGTYDQPGELAMASGGILFLDEMAEFRRDVLEGLREPLEEGVVHVSRAAGARSWDARILLVAAANNCPCGWYGSRKKLCQCQASRLMAYRQRVSGPILDRIDVHLNMEEPIHQVGAILSEPSRRQGQTAMMARRVLDARAMARERFARTGVTLNRDLRAVDILEAFGGDRNSILGAIEKMTAASVSSRSLIRFLRVARTIADVEGVSDVKLEHIERAWSWHPVSAARRRGEVPLN